MTARFRLISALALAAALAGCKSAGDIVVDEGVGISAVRDACPAVGIPDFTGDITLFRTPGDTTAANVDVVAAMTNVRSECNDSGENSLESRLSSKANPEPESKAPPSPGPLWT